MNRPNQKLTSVLGLTVVAVWIPLVAFGFWNQFARTSAAVTDPAGTRVLAADFESWYQTQPRPVGTHPAATVVYLPSTSCQCTRSGSRDVKQLRQRLDADGVRFMAIDHPDAPAPRNANGFEVLVFSAAGQLVYGGPLHSPAFCGGNRTLVDLSLTALSSAGPPPSPLLLPAPCNCGPPLTLI